VTFRDKEPDENSLGRSSVVPCGQIRTDRYGDTVVISRKCYEIATGILKMLSLCFSTVLCASQESLSHGHSISALLRIDSHPLGTLRCSSVTPLSAVL
jgi:hypothetical protein